MMLAYSNNGFSFRAVDDNYTAQTGEVLFTNYATSDQLATAFNGYAAAILTQAQESQLAILDAAAAAAYTTGFSSSATGSTLWYDSDTNTQNQITAAALLALGSASTFTTMYPNGIVIRAKASQIVADSTKQQYTHTAAQIVKLAQDMQAMLATAKNHLWAQQAAVNASTTVQAVQAVNW